MSILNEMKQQLNQAKAKDTEWQGRVHALEEKLHQGVLGVTMAFG